MRYKLSRANSAFTLMEVLVALLVMALVGVVLMQVTSQSTAQAGHLKLKMLAIWVAQDRMTQLNYLSMSNQTIVLGDEEIEQAGFPFRSDATLIQTADGISTIEIAVYQPPKAEHSLYRLTGFLSSTKGEPRNE